MTLSDGYGNARSWCKEHGELLPKGMPVNIPLSLGECSNSSPIVVDKVVPGAAPVIPSQGLQPPAPPQTAMKPSNIRPPLVNNDISNKHSDILENNIPVGDIAEGVVPQFNLNTVPRPVLLPVKPQITMLPVKPSYPPPVFGKHDPQHQWNSKPSYNPRPPLQPYHLQGPPGAWNIVTSKPGSLPPPIHVYQSKLPQLNTQNTNKEGIEIQLGPRLPLPPLNGGLKIKQPFPPRRRPSTPMKDPHIHDMADMSTADSETSVLLSSSTENHLPATERVDEISEADIIVIETNQLKDNVSLDSDLKTLNDSQESIKTDILSDDKLTIFKVGPDNDIVRVSNETADNDTDIESKDDYKFFILHKLPNGDAVNLENLKTYNYEDLIKGHSSVIEDANQEEKFDRENLEFFDVPRRVTNDKKDPYIIYQLPGDKLSDSHSHVKAPAGVKPVYRPNVHRPVYRPVTVQTVHNPALENNQTMTSPTASTTENIAAVAMNTTPDMNTTMESNDNEWIPQNRSDNKLSIETLSELSQLAQVSITDKGPIKIQALPSAIPPKLNVQLLPPRLSAVLSHLDTSHRERDRSASGERERDRHGNSRSILSPHRQNKVSPAFQPGGVKPRERERERQYARRIHNRDYVVTQPYQTQVIPSIKHRYIPLFHQQKKPLWWHPSESQYEFPIRPHQILTNPHSFNMMSRHSLSQNNDKSGSRQTHNGTLSDQKNLTVSLNNTQPPLLFNRKQSVLLGMNQAVKGPIYIISLNNTSTVKPDIPSSAVNGKDQNQKVSSIGHSNDVPNESMQNSTSSTQHLSLNVQSHNYLKNESEVFLGPQSGENILINGNDTLVTTSTVLPLNSTSVESQEHVNLKELSENNESSVNPASGEFFSQN